MNKIDILKPKEKLFYLQEAIHSCKLSPNEIAVYTVLVIFANNKNGKCYPSRKVIADRVNLSTRTVSRVISQLKDKGLIEVVSGINGKTNEYLFLHYSEISTVLCMDDKEVIGETELDCHECPTKGDKTEHNHCHTCPTIKINKDNNYKDKIQIALDEEMQDYYDSIFGNIIDI